MRTFLSVLFILAAAGSLYSQTPVMNPPASDSYSQGMVLFDQAKYAEALPLFEQASKETANKAQAFYHWAYCQKMTGDLRGAALHFYQMDQMLPSPSIRSYADKIKEGLSLEDQAWVEDQLRGRPQVNQAAMALPVAQAPAAPVPGSQTPVEFRTDSFGLRIAPGVDLWSISVLDQEGDAWNSINQNFRSQGYQTTNVNDKAFGGFYFEVNPFLATGDGEFGINYRGYLHTKYQSTITDSNYPKYFDRISTDFDIYSFSGTGRAYFKVSPRCRFYLEPSLGVKFLTTVFEWEYAGTGGSPSAADYGFMVNKAAITAGLQLGFNFKIVDSFTLSLSGGYSYSSFRDLKAEFFDTTYNPARNGVKGTPVTEFNSYYQKYFIWFIPDDASKNNQFFNTPADVAAATPLVIDLSALRMAFDLAFVF